MKLLLHEIISNCFRDNIFRRMLLKLDFAKAYDMLNWGFIMEVLKAKKYGVKWIDRYLKGGKPHIMVIGNSGRMICSKRA